MLKIHEQKILEKNTHKNLGINQFPAAGWVGGRPGWDTPPSSAIFSCIQQTKPTLTD